MFFRKLLHFSRKHTQAILIMAVAAGLSSPAMSRDDKAPSVLKKDEPKFETGEHKGPELDKPGTERGKEGKKAGSTVKKNLVKGAGAAAVTGVATKKIKSSVKGDE